MIVISATSRGSRRRNIDIYGLNVINYGVTNTQLQQQQKRNIIKMFV